MTQKMQPIAGVLPNQETEIRSRYPSIASTGPGRVIGQFSNLIPFSIWGIKLSYLLITPALIPLAVLEYFRLKVFGERYVLTNQSVQRWSPYGKRQFQSVALTDIADIEVVQQPGQEFYHAADLSLVNAKGDPVMTLKGIQRPEVFRQTILKIRDSRRETQQALETIQARA